MNVRTISGKNKKKIKNRVGSYIYKSIESGGIHTTVAMIRGSYPHQSLPPLPPTLTFLVPILLPPYLANFAALTKFQMVQKQQQKHTNGQKSHGTWATGHCLLEVNDRGGGDYKIFRVFTSKIPK